MALLPRDTTWSGIRPAYKVVLVFAVLTMGILSFVSAYMFNEITALPKLYAEKVYVTALYEKMDAGFKDLRDGINEINRFLRDRK
ncbi:hypothetical protein LCGC14_2451460 [marine sediment metagenome]|uniref:Uncharacterized protein n=1 Tax=marine sediment metagenome TaxID=412755 RepID=A0A0F9BG03_9ZZZZ